MAALKAELLPLATLVTPNRPEAEALTGVTIASEQDAETAGEKLLSAGCSWVLIKGGHGGGDTVCDLLLGAEGARAFTSPRLAGGPYHGTGCALSAAITAFLARGLSIPDAVWQARDFLQQLIEASLPLGRGSRVLHPSAVALFPIPDTLFPTPGDSSWPSSSS